LGVKDGVVVDIGGGTTGLTIFENGKAVYTADEPTGGTHISLVLMGGRRVSFDEAERLKRDPAMAREVMGQVKPVIQKMASIVRNHIKGFHVDNIWLVGGTCLLAGIEDIFTSELSVAARVPVHPHLVTPLGIAMSCR
jgi:ethanolamine utilization protein EutJ